MKSGSTFFDAFLFAMVALGAFGAFLDFYIGKAGQTRLRDKLTNWWALLSEVRWNNFGTKEAQTAIGLLDCLVGPRLFSWRRLAASLIIVGFAASVGGLLGLIVANSARTDAAWGEQSDFVIFSPGMFVALVMVAISLSVTRLFSALPLRFGKRANATWFLLLVLLQMALLVIWPPLVSAIRGFISALGILSLGAATQLAGISLQSYFEMLGSGLRNFEKQLWFALTAPWHDPWGSLTAGFTIDVCDKTSCALWAAYSLAGQIIDQMASGSRLLFAFVFFSSYIFRPIIQRPVTTLLARIVESERPVFTLVLGSLAALSKLIQEGMKALG